MTWYWTALPMCVLSHYSHVQLFVTPWTVAHQAPLTMGFSRQEYWSGLPCPLPGHLPDPGIEPTSLTSSALAGTFFFLPLAPPGSPLGCTVRPPTPAKYVQILPFSTCDYGLFTKKVIHRGNEVLVRACWIQGGS